MGRQAQQKTNEIKTFQILQNQLKEKNDTDSHYINGILKKKITICFCKISDVGKNQMLLMDDDKTRSKTNRNYSQPFRHAI